MAILPPSPPEAAFPGALPDLKANRRKGDPGVAPDNNQQAVEIVAAATKVGVDRSEDPSSLDFRVSLLAARLGVDFDVPIHDLVLYRVSDTV